jgi:ParB family chromosome partitioning protein
MKRKRGLGKGLDALIGEVPKGGRRILEVEIHRLHPNPRQPRQRFDEAGLEEMARSISESGILQPILARPADGDYEIIAGERRWRSAQRAGLHTVPVLVREVDEEQMLELALIENLQRQDLNPVEEARAFRMLLDDLSLTQEDVAKRVGKDRATVANAIRLLQLLPEALHALEQGLISAGHAKAILAQKKPDHQMQLLHAILTKDLSVREAEGFKPLSAKEPQKADPDTNAAAESLKERLGVPVEIRRRGSGGRLVIRFANEDELNHLYEVLLSR